MYQPPGCPAARSREVEHGHGAEATFLPSIPWKMSGLIKQGKWVAGPSKHDKSVASSLRRQKFVIMGENSSLCKNDEIMSNYDEDMPAYTLHDKF